MMQSVALTESSLNCQPQQHVEDNNEDDDYVLVDASKTESSSCIVMEGTGIEADFDDEASYDYCEDASPLPSASLSPSRVEFFVESSPNQQETADFVSTKTTTALPPDLSETDVVDALGALEISEIEDFVVSNDDLGGFLVPREGITAEKIDSDEDKRVPVSHMPDSVHDDENNVSHFQTTEGNSGPCYSCSPSPPRPNSPSTPADDDDDDDDGTIGGETKSTVSSASSIIKPTTRLGRLSNKKRRKQMKVAKKAAAATAAAAALSHMRTLTTMSSPSSPTRRNRTRIAPTPLSKKKKQVSPPAAIARKSLTSYKREVATSHHRGAALKIR